MVNKIIKLSAIALAVGVSSSPAIAHAQQDSNADFSSQQCSDIQVIASPGTGSSWTGMAPQGEAPQGAETDLANYVRDAFPGRVGVWNTPYPASAGALWSSISLNNESTTYGDSRLYGDNAAISYMEDYKAQCPNAAFALTGYSQGAHVAGDVAAIVAHGGVEGVTNDDIVSVLLYADPGRSGVSQYTGAETMTGYVPLPQGAAFQKNGEVVNPDANVDNFVGMTGQRSLNFAGLEGKVISLCSPKDVACSTIQGSPIRRIADYSDKDIMPNKAYREGNSLANIIINDGIVSIVKDALKEGVVGDVIAGDLSGLSDTIRTIAHDSESLSSIDKKQLNNAADELDAALEILKSDDAYGNVSDKDIMNHIIKTAYPSFKDNIPLAPEHKVILDNYINALPWPQLPEEVRNNVDFYIDQISTSPVHHSSYFFPGSAQTNVDGMLASDWAKQSWKQGFENYFNGNLLTFNSGDNPQPHNAEVEVAESDRRDDGLRKLMNEGYPFVYEDEDEEDTNKKGDNKVENKTSAPTEEDVVTTYRSSPETKETSKPTSSTSVRNADSASGTTTPVKPVSKLYGATVNTGGSVENDSIFRKVMSIFG